jgi:MFS family permease
MIAGPPAKRSFRSYARRFTAGGILRERDFRLLWLGQSVSILGDQFYLVALPWLVLYLTGSALALGSVLLTATLARVAFQLLGGAISDMVSQRKMMVVSSAVRAVVCAVLSALVLSHQIRLWHLFIIVAVFGMADAFFSPALKAFIPAVVAKENLVAGNSLLNGSSLLAMFIGPSLAGLFIAMVGTGGAFIVDTGSFVFVMICLLLMRGHAPSVSDPDQIIKKTTSPGSHLFRSIWEGLSYTWREPTLRALLIITAVVEFAFAGPFTVGLAALANIKFAGGATAFGAMLSALGAGLVIGTLAVNSLHKRFSFERTILWLTTGLGIGLTLLGLVPNVIWACALMVLIGTIAGYTQVLVSTWLQTKSEPQMRGRVMSVVMLSAYGLTPLSFVLTGALTQHISVSFMFLVTGILLVIALAFCRFPVTPSEAQRATGL